MSSAVEAMSCSGKDIPAGKEEAPKNAVPPVEHGGDSKVANGDAPPHCCRKDADEEDEEEVIDLGPRVSIKDQLERDKVRTRNAISARASQPHALILFISFGLLLVVVSMRCFFISCFAFFRMTRACGGGRSSSSAAWI
jgi:hypothetical protein